MPVTSCARIARHMPRPHRFGNGASWMRPRHQGDDPGWCMPLAISSYHQSMPHNHPSSPVCPIDQR
eukprot:12086288-Alexandrium_andersonii.AAC.1